MQRDRKSLLGYDETIQLILGVTDKRGLLVSTSAFEFSQNLSSNCLEICVAEWFCNQVVLFPFSVYGAFRYLSFSPMKVLLAFTFQPLR